MKPTPTPSRKRRMPLVLPDLWPNAYLIDLEEKRNLNTGEIFANHHCGSIIFPGDEVSVAISGIAKRDWAVVEGVERTTSWNSFNSDSNSYSALWSKFISIYPATGTKGSAFTLVYARRVSNYETNTNTK